MTCYRNRDDERVLRGEHTDACTGAGPNWHPPLTWTDCNGCTPCTRPHCHHCQREHLDNSHPRTCPRCIAHVRADLRRIRDLTTIAEHRLANWFPPVSPGTPKDGASGNETPLPGGDLLVLTGPGSHATNNPIHHLDVQPDDPIAIATELATWADDWWTTQHPDHEYQRVLAPRLDSVIAYLGEHLTWAAQHYPLFADFTGSIAHLLGQLETQLRDEVHVIRGVPCLACGTTLTKRARRPQRCHHRHLPTRREITITINGTEHPGLEPWAEYDARVTAWFVDHLTCDQGGIPAKWTCPSCRRTYDDTQYRNAVAAGSRAFAPALTAAELHDKYGIRPGTTRQLANRGKIRKRGPDPLGRMLYDDADVRAYIATNRTEEPA